MLMLSMVVMMYRVVRMSMLIIATHASTRRGLALDSEVQICKICRVLGRGALAIVRASGLCRVLFAGGDEQYGRLAPPRRGADAGAGVQG